MNATTPPSADAAPAAAVTPTSPVRRVVSEVATWHRPLVFFAVTMIVWGIVCAAGVLIDPRTLGGDPIWAKPLKFTVSLTLYAITLAWMLSHIHRPRLRRLSYLAGTIGATASFIEIVVISLQVVRGTGSHFNISTPLNAGLYALMGSGAVVMYCATLVIGGALAFFTRMPDNPLQWALRLGLIIGMAGLSVGFLMVIPTTQQLAEATPHTFGSHSVGGDDTSGGLFFLGWNTIHGDLRIAHFIGMHALQLLPLLALLLTTLTRLNATTRLRIVLFTATAWASLTALVLWQALRGQSLIHPDPTTWIATITLAALGATAAITIHHAARRDTGPTTMTPAGARS